MPNQDNIQAIAASLLRPIVAFLLARGLRLRELVELVKIVLVTIAREELENSGTPVSSSKLALMTGVHRKDIAALGDSPKFRPLPQNPLIKVIGAWKTSPKYTTKAGKPRPLDLTGKDSEFAELVRSVHSELNPYSVLFELQRITAVIERDGMAHLSANEYIPKNSFAEEYNNVSRDVQLLLSGASENIELSPKIPNLHLTTSFDNIAATSHEELRKWCLARGAALHEEARAEFGAHDRDINPSLPNSEKRYKISLGTFSYVEEIVEKAPLSLTKK